MYSCCSALQSFPTPVSESRIHRASVSVVWKSPSPSSISFNMIGLRATTQHLQLHIQTLTGGETNQHHRTSDRLQVAALFHRRTKPRIHSPLIPNSRLASHHGLVFMVFVRLQHHVNPLLRSMQCNMPNCFLHLRV